MKKYRRFVLAALFSILAHQPLPAQDQSAFPDGYKRNVIKWNLTPFLLWSKKDINISYERILSPYRSFSVNAGYFEMPTTGLFDSLYLTNTKKKAVSLYQAITGSILKTGISISLRTDFIGEFTVPIIITNFKMMSR